MSTRRERANRWWLRCPKCKEWKARHFVPPGFGTPGFYICSQRIENGKVVEAR